MSDSRSQPIQAVSRALRLLRLFAPSRTDDHRHRSDWSITELAERTGIHKSMVTRLMATMSQDGFVVQDPISKRYSIGPQAFAVGNSYEPNTVLNKIARPTMESLSLKCGHATYLAVPSGDHYIILIAVEGNSSIRVSIRVGELRTYHSGAAGKVFLSSLPNERIRDLVGPDPLQKLTPHTIDSLDELLGEISEVQRTGVAFNREETILGAGSIAVPIKDTLGETTASLIVVYPTHVVQNAEIRDLIVLVKESAQEISNQLH